MVLHAQYLRGEPLCGQPSCSTLLMDEKNGCVNKCVMGVTESFSEEYETPGVHPGIQEGFVVLSGCGWAKVGDDEFELSPDTAFIAPAGAPHTVKKAPGSEPLKIFWFHAAI